MPDKVAYLLVRVEQDAQAALVLHVVLVCEASQALVLLAQRLLSREALDVQIAQLGGLFLLLARTRSRDRFVQLFSGLHRGVELILQGLYFVSQRLDCVLYRQRKC